LPRKESSIGGACVAGGARDGDASALRTHHAPDYHAFLIDFDRNNVEES